MYGWNFTDTHNFTLQHRRESFELCIIALLCDTYQPRLCALELLPKELTGGISDDPHNPDTRVIQNSSNVFYTELTNIEDVNHDKNMGKYLLSRGSLLRSGINTVEVWDRKKRSHLNSYDKT